jgi:ABC-type lipoprotein export system ATPase subunit/multidrug resistance efflux pump
VADSISKPKSKSKSSRSKSKPKAGEWDEDRGSAGRGTRMDITREATGNKRKPILIGAGVAVVAVIALLLALMKPAAPTVQRNAVLIGAVERGPMVRAVRGPGTLVPEQMRFVSALTAGRVEQVHVEPGETVEEGTVLLQLSNPDVELEALQAQQQWTAARAGLVDLRRSLGTQTLAQEASLAQARAAWLEANRTAESDSAFYLRELISRNEALQSREQAEAARIQLSTEEKRYGLLRQTVDEQLEVQAEQVDRLRSIFEYQRRRVESMKVTAGADGVLQDLSLEPGQWVQSGTTLARVAQPGRLQAELRIPQTQAREVQPGQQATIDTRSDLIEGRVKRVDPNVQNGAVLVEVALTGELPRGARPDLSVDGTIEIERLADVLHVGRPAYGQSHSTVGLFKLAEGGNAAVRVPVRLGASSVNEIEIIDGLEEGESRRRRGTMTMSVTNGANGAGDAAAMIEMTDVSKVFLTDEIETHALSDVQLRIDEGDFLSIAGPSGCGKSTLLSLLGLLDSPSSGEYLLDGNPVADLSSSQRATIRNRHIGFIFQAFNLIGDLTVYENVELPLTYRGLAGPERKERVMNALERVDMPHRVKHYPSQLSGGQQQRVAVARAVAGDPLILLADEPTGNLDSSNGEAVMNLLAELHGEGATICMVTHDPRYADYAGRTIHLFDGRIVSDESNGAVRELQEHGYEVVGQ